MDVKAVVAVRENGFGCAAAGWVVAGWAPSPVLEKRPPVEVGWVAVVAAGVPVPNVKPALSRRNSNNEKTMKQKKFK